MAAKRINWTTGPINAGADQTDARILILNNTSSNRKATIRLYDLGFTPKKKVFEKTYSLVPFETITVTLKIGSISAWEAQASAFSKSVRFYVTGLNSGGINSTGTTVLNSEFIQFGT